MINLLVALVAFISALITFSIGVWAAYKRLKKELHLAHRSELIKKQMEACERLWQALEMELFSPGNNRMLTANESRTVVDIEKAKEFINNIISVFHAPVGIYLSRNVRKSL